MVKTRMLSMIVGLLLLAMVMVGCGTLTGAAVGAGAGAAVGAAPKKVHSSVPVWEPQQEPSTTSLNRERLPLPRWGWAGSCFQAYPLGENGHRVIPLPSPVLSLARSILPLNYRTPHRPTLQPVI
jgi:hypothetical protein